MKATDYTGQEFGCVKVLRRVGSTPHGAALWDCVCTCGCGAHKLFGSSSLHEMKKRKYPRRCLQESHHVRHGGAYSRLYYIWQGMRERCSNPNYQYYDYYGGRGISVCPEWQESFQAFQAWAISAGYDENAPRGQCTLDRINNDGNYEPSNCRWADGHTQNMNSRRHFNRTDITPYIEPQQRGEITISQACKELGISESSWYRIKRKMKRGE